MSKYLRGAIKTLMPVQEAVSPIDPGLDLEDQLAELTKRMDAARRGLGLANKMSGREQKQHRSRVMGNLNSIRAALTRVMRQIEQFDQAAQKYEAGFGYGREHE